jgi:predicted nucleotidyltransferase
MPIESLTALAIKRLGATKVGKKCLEESTEIVVFGSRSVGLERADSDIDILCIGGFNLKLKTAHLDLNAIQTKETRESHWLNSELASHIAEYGSWIKGTPDWIVRVHIGEEAIEAKRRRVAAFMRALPDKWSGLYEGFREKYSIKLRRETQRLLFLERGEPIPPTKILDSYWKAVSSSSCDVHNCLRRFSNSHRTSFEQDLFTRIDLAMQAQDSANSQLVQGATASVGSALYWRQSTGLTGSLRSAISAATSERMSFSAMAGK